LNDIDVCGDDNVRRTGMMEYSRLFVGKFSAMLEILE